MKVLGVILFIVSIIVFITGINYYMSAKTIMVQNFGMNHLILAMVLFIGGMIGVKE